MEGFANVITYRKATPSDSEKLTQLRMQNTENHTTDNPSYDRQSLYKSVFNHFSSHISDGLLITWLACNKSDIIATSGLTFLAVTPSPSDMTGKTGYITNMYTCPNYRRQGIARKLLQLTLDEAKLQKCGRIVLYGTTMANPLYTQFGFQDSHGYMTLKLV